jgi:hypothetical protein
VCTMHTHHAATIAVSTSEKGLLPLSTFANDLGGAAGGVAYHDFVSEIMSSSSIRTGAGVMSSSSIRTGAGVRLLFFTPFLPILLLIYPPPPAGPCDRE